MPCLEVTRLTACQVGALLAAYTLAMFACYSLVPFVLKWSGAAVLNLSLLSSNLWAAFARALLLGEPSVDSPPDHDTSCACVRSRGSQTVLPLLAPGAILLGCPVVGLHRLDSILTEWHVTHDTHLCHMTRACDVQGDFQRSLP